MKKIIILAFTNLFIVTLSFAQPFPPWQANLLYNWQDTTLVPSWQYDNTYNEIWGVQINGAEIAIIGSTAGTHFFDVTDPAIANQVDFVDGAYTGNDESEFESRFPTNLHTICNNGLCKEYEAFTNIVRGVTPLAMYLQLISFMYRGHLYPEYIRR